MSYFNNLDTAQFVQKVNEQQNRQRLNKNRGKGSPEASLQTKQHSTNK